MSAGLAAAIPRWHPDADIAVTLPGQDGPFRLELAIAIGNLASSLTPNKSRARCRGVGPALDEEEYVFDSADDEQALRQQACDLVKAYLAYAPTDEKPLAVEVALEAPLVDPDTGEDLGMPLVGVVDLMLDYEGGPLICDFKTAARSSEPMQIANEIQLTSYAYLLRHHNQWAESGLEIRSLIKTKTPKVEFHPYPPRTDAHFRRLFAVVREYIGCSRPRAAGTIAPASAAHFVITVASVQRGMERRDRLKANQPNNRPPQNGAASVGLLFINHEHVDVASGRRRVELPNANARRWPR